MTQATSLRFGILGPLDASVVTDAGARTLDLGSFKQRILLAVLLCHSGAVVSVDQLTDALWEGRPPRTAAKNIQVYVSHLRRLLRVDGGPDLIRFRPPGYLVDVEPAALDAMRFEGLVRAGRAALRERRPAEAAALLGQGLQLWRGAALADLVAAPALRTEAARFDDRRLTVYEDWIEAELALGRHADVLDRIESLVRVQPLRERLRSQQMIALYRYGRQAEALAEYDNLRHALARELGLQPTPALQRLYAAVLSGDPSLDAGVVTDPTSVAEVVRQPALLPRDIEDFCGRERPLARLVAVLTGDRGSRARRLVTITGPPGVGKTALAVHTAHRLRRHFPDGQLFVSMRDTDGGRYRDTSEVLAVLLRQLGFDEAELPAPTEERAALLREWLAGRRVLLILDDAGSEAHVRPLLPGSGASAVLVTGRSQLGGLESAYPLTLGPFAPEEAADLLRRILGAERVDADPAAARRIARSCGLLPLALRIVGAKLAGRPHVTTTRYASRLDDSTLLDELVVGDLAMRATVQRYFTDLKPRQQAVFRLLSVLPDTEVTSELVAGLLKICPRVAENLLDELSDAHAVVPGAGRAGDCTYVVPNPLRLYARECGPSGEPLAAILQLPALRTG